MTNAAAATPSLALTADWTNSSLSPTFTNTSNLAVFNNAAQLHHGYLWNSYWYPYYTPLVVEHRDTRPIRLTMSEVERLRVAAKKDKQLRETLEKFTDHIEVVVDFPAK